MKLYSDPPRAADTIDPQLEAIATTLLAHPDQWFEIEPSDWPPSKILTIGALEAVRPVDPFIGGYAVSGRPLRACYWTCAAELLETP
jgi:hypothetical protein